MSIQIFENTDFGQIRIIEISGEPWFMASDIAMALGYEKPNNAVNAHCKKINKFSYPETGQPVNIIPESDVYRLIMRSKLESAERFQDWVMEEVLPTIRQTGQYQHQTVFSPAIPQAADIQRDFAFADALAGFLRVSEDSRIRMASVLAEQHNVPKALIPSYTGPSRVRFAATTLLKKHGSPMGVKVFNQKLVGLGLLKEAERGSRDGKFVRKFKTLTSAGMAWGENVTSPQNPRETQPLYYEDTFQGLLELLESTEERA